MVCGTEPAGSAWLSPGPSRSGCGCCRGSRSLASGQAWLSAVSLPSTLPLHLGLLALARHRDCCSGASEAPSELLGAPVAHPPQNLLTAGGYHLRLVAFAPFIAGIRHSRGDSVRGLQNPSDGTGGPKRGAGFWGKTAEAKHAIRRAISLPNCRWVA